MSGRRLVARALAPIGLLAVLVLAVPAFATEGTGRFAGSRFESPSNGSESGLESFEVTLTARYRTPSFQEAAEGQPGGQRIDSISIAFQTAGSYTPPTGCGVPASKSVDYGPSDNVAPGETHAATISFPATFGCNGTYQVSAQIASNDPSGARPAASTTVSSTFDVVVAPPTVPKPTLALGEGRVVSVSWSPLAPKPRDFAGYAVQRADPEGAFATITTTTDTKIADPLPAAAGEYRYRVLALRNAPGGAVSSNPTATSAAAVEAGPGPTTTTAEPGSSGTTTPPPTFRTSGSSPPRVGTRVTLPRIGTNIPDLPTTVTTADTGFGETLDYGDLPELGADEEAFGGATILNEDDEFKPKGLLVPAAGGMVLAVWAMHLRHLSRLARAPTAAAVGEAPALTDPDEPVS